MDYSNNYFCRVDDYSIQSRQRNDDIENTIKTLADMALDAENARKLKDELGIK